MRDLLRLKYKRKPFEEAYSQGIKCPVPCVVPVEVDGSVVRVTTTKPYQRPVEEVLYSAFTAARVFELGDVTPIQLFNNMSSAEKLQYVQSFEQLVDDAMLKVDSQK